MPEYCIASPEDLPYQDLMEQRVSKFEAETQESTSVNE